jgi:4-amino-4-deoxy-L-arabinose transferase-like glycosyltransferase
MGNADSFDSEPTRKEYLVMGILAGGALLVRLLFLSSHRILSGDELHYAESLFRFLHGRFLAGISDYWSFLYPFAAIPFGWLAGDPEAGLRLFSAFSGAALVIPAFLIARRLWGYRTAVFAGLFVALQPNLISFSTAALTEPLYSLLLLWAVLLLLGAAATGALRRYAAAGAVLALAYLVRSEGIIVLFLFIIAVLAGWGGGSERAPLAVRARRSLAMAALFAVALIPYLFLMHAATGRWTAGSKAAVNLSSPVIWQDDLAREEYVYRLNEEGTARRIEDLGRENPARILWRQKGAIASQYIGKLTAGIRIMPGLFSSPLLILLVPLGLVGRRWKRGSRGGEFLLLALGVFPFVLYPIFRVELRYLIPYLPIYLLWGGAGCRVLLDWFADTVTTRRAVRSILAALIFLSLVPFTLHKYAFTARTQPREWKAIGEWIKANEAPASRVLAQPGCSISYYAGNPIASFIPWTDSAGLVRFARLGHYDLLAIDEAYIRAMRPTMRAILESPPPDLEEVGEFGGAAGGRIILYRLGPSS